MGRALSFKTPPQMLDTAIQKNELVRLINDGFPFEIEITVKKRKPGILGFFLPKEVVKETRQFLIKEPTLATLDRIALISADINTDLFSDEENVNIYLKKNSRLHYRKMANVIAIAVAQPGDNINDLTEIFFAALKPSHLLQIIELIDVASNLQDFMTSTLMVTAAKAHTTKAESVEKEELPDLQVHTVDEE